METHLSQTIDITNDNARYDTSVKEMLADKQVLARILKYSLQEFQDDEIEDIMRNMDMPVVSQVRMEPGQTNLNKVETTSEEDSVPGEGKVFYDIRFSVFRGTEQIKILINLEAQKTTKESKLGYQLDNRIIYYLGRMIMNDETGRRLDVMCNLSEVVMEKGIEKGIEKGETRLNNLYRLLMEQNRIDDVQKAIANEEYRSALYAEFNL